MQLGFIGLGNMGGRMTRRLVDAGITVIGHDPEPGRAEQLIVAGFFDSIADQVPLAGARDLIGRALAERSGVSHG